VDIRQLRPGGLASRATDLAGARTPITKIIRQPVSSTSSPAFEGGIRSRHREPASAHPNLFVLDVAAQMNLAQARCSELRSNDSRQCGGESNFTVVVIT